jgi:hypothetical protein
MSGQGQGKILGTVLFIGVLVGFNVLSWAFDWGFILY